MTTPARGAPGRALTARRSPPRSRVPGGLRWHEDAARGLQDPEQDPNGRHECPCSLTRLGGMYDVALTVAACLRSGTRVDVAWVVGSEPDGLAQNASEAFVLKPGGSRVDSL